MARVYARNCLSAQQLDALGVYGVDPVRCSDVYVNNCGADAAELAGLYSLYDPSQGYDAGDRVLLLSEYGKRFTVYESAEEITAPAGPFDEQAWSVVCEVSPVTAQVFSLGDFPSGDDSTPYALGDRIAFETDCGDVSCVYECQIAESTVPFVPSEWRLLFCAANGNPNRCGKSFKCTGYNRKVVRLSAEGDFACVPVESYVDV